MMKKLLVLLFSLIQLSLTAQLKTVEIGEKSIQTQDAKITIPSYKPHTTSDPISASYHPISLSDDIRFSIPESNAATYLYGQLNPALRQLRNTDKVEAAWKEIKKKYTLSNPLEYSVIHEEMDDLGIQHTRIQQLYNGIPIYGGDMMVHIQPDGNFLMNGYIMKNSVIEKRAEPITSEDALTITWNDLGGEQPINDKLGIFAEANNTSTPYYMEIDGLYELVFVNQVYKSLGERWEYIVNAHTGEVLDKYLIMCKFHNHNASSESHTTSCTHDHKDPISLSSPTGAVIGQAKDLFGKTIDVNAYEISGTYYLINTAKSMFKASQSNLPDEPVGAIWTIDAFNTSPQRNNFSYDHVKSGSSSFNSKNAAVSAHDNAGKAYNYYRSIHNRTSINGSGGNIISLVNVANENGGSMGNAFWNGVGIFYGNGDGAFQPLARALDVAGHEMSHGVIQNTANLQYRNESGALNESFADIFGAMIERKNWLMGEDVVKSAAFPSGALRNLADPHNGASTNDFNRGWQPKHYSERYRGNEDQGGVHINSGIPNHAYYLFATNADMDISKAEKVYYRALTKYLTSSSNFTDLRNAVIKSTQDLYGNKEVRAAEKAFDQVGIAGGTGSNNQTDIDENPGDEYILFTTSDQKKLYIANNNGELLFNGAITDENPISVPSVTDNGSEIIFVNERKELWYIFINWETGEIQENSLNSTTKWRSAVFSKDGKRLAAVREAEEPIIFVYDFDLGTGENFELVNGTYSSGYETNDVKYADAMEFDHSGEFVIYDAYNSLKSSFGNDINYWDINFMKVFENSSNSFAGQKQVQKLFNNLERGESVGNPTFSKNSPYIIAFDYLNGNNISVLGANIETGETGKIFENLSNPGYPNYTLDDSQVIFNFDNQGTDVIALANLNNNKISSNLEAFLRLGYNDANIKWGRIVGTGDRVLSSVDEVLQDNIHFYPNPVESILTIDNGTSEDIIITLTTLSGQSLLDKSSSSPSTDIDVSSLPQGMYVITFQRENGGMLSKLLYKK